MKRKNNDSLSLPILCRRIRLTLDGLHFDFTFSGDVDFAISSIGGHTIEKHDELFFLVELHPAQAIEALSDMTIRLTHVESRHCGVRFNVYDKESFHQVIDKVNDGYCVFPSHALRYDPLKQGHINQILFNIQNMQMRGDNPSPVIVLDVDFGLELFPKLFPNRFFGLSYVPPTISLETLNIDASQVPQRIPLWFKLRGSVSGSTIPSLLGYYTPGPNDSAKKHEQFQNEWIHGKKFTGWQAVNLRFGKSREWNIVMAYLTHYSQRSFSEVGYVTHPENPNEWGASPDGILTDPSVTWEDLPDETKEQFKPKDFKRGLTKGAAEFKASRFDCKFRGTHIPQLMWEMMSLSVAWGDLVRYSEVSKRLPNGNFGLVKTCKSIRFYRDRSKERRLMELVAQAKEIKDSGDINKFLTLVRSPPYVEMRKDFDSLALQADQDADVILIPNEHAQILQEYEQQFFAQTERTLVDTIDEHHAQLMNEMQNQKESTTIIATAAQQIQNLGQLVQKFL